jgi:type II secretory pathway component GspD/PulD (secretin)
MWGPGSNGIDLASGSGGLNYSTQQGVGWSWQVGGGRNVTGFSLQSSSTSSNGYLTTSGTSSVIRLSVPSNVVVEVWEATPTYFRPITINSLSPGADIVFIAKSGARYGGFAWYTDNRQADLAINANYLLRNQR